RRDRALSSLFPYTTLFRSGIIRGERIEPRARVRVEAEDHVALALHVEEVNRPRDLRGDGRFLTLRGLEARDGRLEVLAFLEVARSEEHTSELQSRENLVCR